MLGGVILLLGVNFLVLSGENHRVDQSGSARDVGCQGNRLSVVTVGRPYCVRDSDLSGWSLETRNTA